MTAYDCTRCGATFMSARLLLRPCLCPACNTDETAQGAHQGRRLNWWDSPAVAAPVAPDAHNRAVGAARLEGFE